MAVEVYITNNFCFVVANALFAPPEVASLGRLTAKKHPHVSYVNLKALNISGIC